jgi:Flp pilus assembly protein TadG
MRRLTDEDGATAVIVAILLVALVGMTAFVVDIGDVMWERRMLQTSAEAAALAVAIDCAQGDCQDFDTTARDYADQNNRRGARVTSIVGRDGVSPPTPADGQVTVLARTGTREAEGRLRQWFSAVLGQNEGLATGASATAVWGTTKIVDSELPLVVSICDWERYTGLDFPPTEEEIATLPTVAQLTDPDHPKNSHGSYFGATLTPPMASHPTGFSPPITIHDSDPEGADICTTAPGFSSKDGAKYPGGFGWIDPSKGTCNFEIRQDEAGNQFADAKGGLGKVGKACLPPNLGKAVVIPIFVAFYGNVGNGEYEILTPAAFYLTGYANVPGLTDTAGADVACDNKKDSPYFADKKGGAPTCITGHFVQKIEAGGTIIADPNAGVSSVRLSD